jgi:hypothetical protein
LLPLGPAHWSADSPLRSITWILRGDGDAVDQIMRAYPGSFADAKLVDTYRFPSEDTVRVYRREHRQ